MSPRAAARRLGLAAVIAGLAIGLTACDPPVTVNTTVTYDCQIDPHHFLLPPFSDTLDGDYSVVGPQAVKPGAQFDVTVTPEPITLNAGTGGGSVSQISNIVWRVAVPTGTTLVSQSIAGWANVGPGTPTSSVSGNTISITVPGPVAANVTATFPTLVMKLQATGALGSRVQPKIGGTSYASPGLTLGARVIGTPLGTLNATLACFPSPSPALHSILISNDTAAPTITITAPTAGQTITQGATVLAGYSCSDGSGVGVATCTGTVANGAPLNTSTLGSKTFTVNASDNEGKTSSKTVSYTVVAA
jgi:dehydratase